MTGVSGQSRWSPCWRDDGPVYGICGLHAVRSVYDATMTGGLCGGYPMGNGTGAGVSRLYHGIIRSVLPPRDG